MDRSPHTSLSIRFPHQEYWNESPFPAPDDLPTQGSNLYSALAGRFFTADPPGLPLLGTPLIIREAPERRERQINVPHTYHQVRELPRAPPKLSTGLPQTYPPPTETCRSALSGISELRARGTWNRLLSFCQTPSTLWRQLFVTLPGPRLPSAQSHQPSNRSRNPGSPPGSAGSARTHRGAGEWGAGEKAEGPPGRAGSARLALARSGAARSPSAEPPLLRFS